MRARAGRRPTRVRAARRRAPQPPGPGHRAALRHAAPAPAPTTTETEQQQQQETDADFSKMTVAQLKVELEKRNLPQDGLKAALIQRLEEAA